MTRSGDGNSIGSQALNPAKSGERPMTDIAENQGIVTQITTVKVNPNN
jgi:hypothetical protein